ncbi:Hypp3118 [Branchiostoma lanceolatum]|uniref:Hypp3118 protein n=1 Tax=Branchiostoma lanceolatum TaxID=7740 RepID=A0A8J9ZYB7_BRALA|nr:Hypp3118 [Branchiostoma lanceolatum]
MKPTVLVLALSAVVLKVLVLSPSGGQAQTTEVTVTDVDGFQVVTATPIPGSFTTLKCAEACLNATSCLAFQGGISPSTTACNLYKTDESDRSGDYLYFKIPTKVTYDSGVIPGLIGFFVGFVTCVVVFVVRCVVQKVRGCKDDVKFFFCC